MNDTKLGNKSVTFAAHTTIYEKKVRVLVNAFIDLNIFFSFSYVSLRYLRTTLV